MKNLVPIVLVCFMISASSAQDLGWPRQKSNAGGTLVYYQPQLDEWKDHRQLEARMAVSIKPKAGQPTVGVIYLRASTDANLETRNVVISHLEITSTRFPSLDAAGAAAMDHLVRSFLPPDATMDISLDRLLAQLEENKQDTAPVAVVRNDPPKIFVAYGSAILLLVDGELVRAPIEKTGLEYVVNTNWDLFFDKSDSKYYLLDEKRWLTAAMLEGPWTATTKLPKDMSKIPDQPNWADVKKAIPPPVGAAVGATVAYGSGYYYPPYYYYGPYPYPIYRPYPVTYGVGAFYNPNNGAYGYARGAYGPYGGVAGGAWYNPSSGTYGRAAGACGPYGCAGGARAYNPYTGAYGATRQGSNAYSQWGSSVVTKGDKWAQTGHYPDSRGTVAGGRTSEGGRVVGGSGQNGSGFVGQGGGGDVHAGKDGNVYKKTTNGWQQYENGGWNSVDKSGAQANAQAKAQSAGATGQRAQTAQTSAASGGQARGTQAAAGQMSSSPQGGGQRAPSAVQSSQMQSLDREAKARQTGTERTQNYQRQSRSSGARSGGSRRR